MMTLRLQPLRRNFAYSALCAAIVAAASLFASGCASSARNVTPSAHQLAVHDKPEAAIAEEEAGADPTEPETFVDDSEGIDLIDIDEALVMAREACDDSLFDAADSILRRAAAFLMKNSELFDSNEQAEPDGGNQPPPLQDYVADIISIYAELMPPSYSTPEEISALIFSQHILETLLDSLKVSPQDSVFLARLSNKRGVVYDVPMVWNDRVKRALLFYLRTRNGVFDRWLHRAGYYLPVMKQMFADSGLPQDLAHLPIIESGFNPHAYSRAHAAGIWQFIPSTGRVYGLRQNYWIDERRDPLKSTGAAIRYLNKLYGDFGNWHIALASYNCGEGGMARAIRRAGNVYDYWAISLPKETMNYVPLYLASLIIAKNPDVFDFVMQDSVVFDPDTVFVNDCIEMAAIADGIDVPLDTLKRLNPHILHWCTPPDMQDVRLYLPKGYADAFREFYKDLPDEKKTKFYRYRIQSGDNLLQVARNFRVPVEALREINKMKSNYIGVGKYLIIPVPLSDSVPTALASRLNTSERERPSKRASYGGGQQRGKAAPRTGRKISYKVRAGETLYSISNTFGVSVRDLMSWNYLASPRSLKAEQTLVIYQKEQTAQAAQTAPSAQAAPPAQKARSAEAGHTGKRLVKQGETLYGISQELGVPVNELARINGLNAKRPLIFPGDVLVYTPRAGQSGGAADQNANAGTGQSAGARAGAGTSQSASAQAPRASTPQPTGPVVIYTVKSGDNLWRIALNFGVTVDSIRNDNNLTANSVIMPGDILRITRGGN